MWAMAMKEFRQMRRDRRTLAMMILLPVLLLVVFGYAASFDVDQVKTVVVGPRAEQVAAALPDRLEVVRVAPGEGREAAVEALRDADAAVAVVTSDAGQPQVLVDGADLFSARSVVTELRGRPGLPTPEVLFNPGLETSAIMVPGLMGVVLVFVGTIATALGVVRERQSGTLEQLAVMPFRARDVLAGKLLPYLGVAVVDLAVIVAVGVLLFDVPFRGSPLVFALGAIEFLFVTVGIGVLISTVSETQGQAIQLAIMTMLPQILLSGLIFPLPGHGPGGPLDRLPAAPHLLRPGGQGGDGQGRPVRGPDPPAGHAGRARHGRVRPVDRPLPPRPGPGRPGPRRGRRRRPGPGGHGQGGRPMNRDRTSWGCRRLGVRYGATVALEEVTFEVAAGTVAAVVGGDGAGKTSLLRALAGTVRPAAGTVRRPAERRLGYVSAGPGVWADLTVDENLSFSGRAYGLSAGELDRRVGGLLERTGLAEARDRLAGRLSGGMRQKLALAMAVAHEPDLLILDEPTTGVDPVSRAELWRLLAASAAGGAAVVVATTYLDEAERAATVLVLDRGRSLLAGTPDEVVAATPGLVVDAAARPDGIPSWRRGSRWRAWSPDGSTPPGTGPATLDLEDAVIVAQLREDQRWAA